MRRAGGVLAAVVMLAGLPAPVTAEASVLAPGLAGALGDGAGSLPIIVSFTGRNAAVRYLRVVEGRTGIWLGSVNAIALTATRDEIRDLSRRPGVRYVELDERHPVMLSTATTATRARSVWGTDEGGPIPGPVPGQVMDGSGVAVVVVDTGIEAVHPDLAGRVAGNYRIIGTKLFVHLATGQYRGTDLLIGSPVTDTSGHGTHIASVVAGSGVASGGQLRGVAPGATLYGFAAADGPVIVTSHAAAALDWVLHHYDQVTPAIRVVVNAWGPYAGADFDPRGVLATLARGLVHVGGITVVWAAGNAGGDCSVDLVPGLANDPTPGMISVAGYDDDDTGTRDGSVDASSSRGASSDPSSWPDLSAPGTAIRAALSHTGAQAWVSKAAALDPDPQYVELTGTSIAAAHVAGVAAMLLQVDHTFTPAEIEDILEDTAHQFTSGAAYAPDPANPDSPSSCDKGHGLVDARTAVLRALEGRS